MWFDVFCMDRIGFRSGAFGMVSACNMKPGRFVKLSQNNCDRITGHALMFNKLHSNWLEPEKNEKSNNKNDFDLCGAWLWYYIHVENSMFVYFVPKCLSFTDIF